MKGNYSGDLRAIIAGNWGKVLAAFSAGLLVFLGSAFFFSRTRNVETGRVPASGSAIAKMPVGGLPTTLTLNPNGEVTSSPPREETPNEETQTVAEPAQSESTLQVKPTPPRRPRTNTHAEPKPRQVQEAAAGSEVSPTPLPVKESLPLAKLMPPMTPALTLPKASILVVPSDTPLQIRLTDNLSSRRSHAGETFRAALATPLIADGSIIAPQGALVLGRVVDARKAKVIHGHSDLVLELTELATASQGPVAIRTTQWFEQGSRTQLLGTAKKTTGVALGTVASLLTAGHESGFSGQSHDQQILTAPASGATVKQKAIDLPAGTELTFRLLEPLRVGAK